jgi:hypothetical protein
VATDDFNRSNESPLASPWTADSVVTDPFVLVSNFVTNTNFGTGGVVYRTDSAVASSQLYFAGGFHQAWGPAIECDGAGNFYFQDAGGFLVRSDSGSLTNIAFDFTGISVGDTIRCYRSGSNVIGYRSSVGTDLTASDTTYTGGYDGIYCRSAGFAELDDWDNGAGGGGGATSLAIPRRMARFSSHFR